MILTGIILGVVHKSRHLLGGQGFCDDSTKSLVMKIVIIRGGRRGGGAGAIKKFPKLRYVIMNDPYVDFLLLVIRPMHLPEIFGLLNFLVFRDSRYFDVQNKFGTITLVLEV